MGDPVCGQGTIRHTLDYQGLRAHWNSIFPGFIHEIHHEKLAANQEVESRRLLDYCGLSWDARCLDFHQTDRPVQTASLLQVRKPMYRSSVEG
ncbi:MAG: sulfotransferase [Magnetococcales bacterium]|nr:sulfotransferase [Magnetococcales bacterium]